MTHVRRKIDSKKQRKSIFRKMKKLSCCIAKHGKCYRELLNNGWEKTDWSHAQAKQVIQRIDLILEQLPSAIKQAHERIIGERIVPTEDKILSLYDKDTRVIVRGKAGNEVEFGQGLLLTEQAAIVSLTAVNIQAILTPECPCLNATPWLMPRPPSSPIL
jgi:hypothetical protein